MRLGRAPMRRRGGGLVGTMARTAVVAGTATTVAGSVQRRQAANAQAAEPAPAPVAEPAAQGPTSETLATLERLAALQQQGVLTPEEFAVQKARLLGL